jgi:hypothetical protein
MLPERNICYVSLHDEEVRRLRNVVEFWFDV